MQTQTRRLQTVALLATRQEAEFVSGVLDAADLPHAVVESSGRFELRVDADDAGRVRELIDRLDVRRLAEEGTRQRSGEAAGRRVVLLGAAAMLVGAGALIAMGVLGLPRSVPVVALGVVLAGAGAVLAAIALRKARR